MRSRTVSSSLHGVVAFAACAAALVAFAASVGGSAGCVGGTRCAARAGSPGRCVDVACPKGSTPTRGACACDEGSTVVMGACIGYDFADEFCGADARIQPGGACAPKVCEAGSALDLQSGLCLPDRTTLAAMGNGMMGDGPGSASAEHFEPDETLADQRARCMVGQLVVRSLHPPFCLLGERGCGRGQTYERQADAGMTTSVGGMGSGSVVVAGQCVAATSCDAGELFDEVSGQCVRVIRAGGGAGAADYVVDVGAWARLALGIDGGEGTRALCAPVRAAQDGGNPVALAVRLVFPGNDATQVGGRIAAQAPTVVLDAAEQSLGQVLETLRHLGGMTTAGSVSLNVTCTPPPTTYPTTENMPPEDAGAKAKAR
jgi:hypothetical protein